MEPGPQAAVKTSTEVAVTSFDYVRFVWSDVHGIARSKLVPRRHAGTFMQHGISVYYGNQLVGPRSQGFVFDEVQDWLGNCIEMPDPTTLRAVPWAGNQSPGGSTVSIGQVLCESLREDTHEPLPLCPRGMVHRLMDQLKAEFGLRLMTGVEHEFVLLDSDTLKPVNNGTDIFTTLLFSKFESFFTTVEKNLDQVGVDIESMLPEYQQGQFELVTHATLGMQGVDASFLLKEGLKEMSSQAGYMATFMTRPFEGKNTACSSGTHFNISLWNEDDQNVFVDNSDPNRMSQTFRHWLAGILHHSPALTALCCPTVNCYRRLHQPWTPHDAKWGLDNRTAVLRVRHSHSGAFVENRLPGAACNPYLVTAGMLAAGMDGLKRKLDLPPEMHADAQVFPHTLEEALLELESNTILGEALGPRVVQLFCQLKRDIELKELKDVDITTLSDASMAAEQHMYLEYI